MSCNTCGKPAVGFIMKHIGDLKDPKHEGTQQDTRRVLVIRYCKAHRP